MEFGSVEGDKFNAEILTGLVFLGKGLVAARVFTADEDDVGFFLLEFFDGGDSRG